MRSTPRIRRILARICSADTMSRIVEPTLADMHHESDRRAWLGYLALGRALALHATVSVPGAVARTWNDDGRALPRALWTCALVTLALAVPLVAIPANAASRVSWYAVVLLLPQALALALPTSLLVAIPLAFRRTSNGRGVLARGLLLSVFCAAATLVLMIQVLPDANQAFRVEVMKRIDARAVHVPRGPMEMTLHDLRERIQALRLLTDRLTPEGLAEVRQFEYTYQMKLALSAIALPLGVLAIAITIAARGRVRQVVMGTVLLLIYIVGVFGVDGWATQLLRRSDAVSAGVLAWVPTMLIAALATVVLWKSRFRMTNPCA
jgi:hypothetical protein